MSPERLVVKSGGEGTGPCGEENPWVGLPHCAQKPRPCSGLVGLRTGHIFSLPPSSPV